MAAFVGDPAFAAAHLPPAPIRFRAKSGKIVEFLTIDGKPGHGFFVPPKANNTAAILMFHEWWGLNDNIKNEAEKLHDELGSAILAVDLYDGKVTTDPGEAGKLMQGMNGPRGSVLVNGAITALKSGSLDHAKSIGT